VTDYIVAYACKGNETLIEEMKQMKALILGMNDISGTSKDEDSKNLVEQNNQGQSYIQTRMHVSFGKIRSILVY